MDEPERLDGEVAGLLKVAAGDGAAARAAERRMAEIEGSVEDATRRADAARAQLAELGPTVDNARLSAALASWDEVWASVPHRERVRLVHLLLEEVVFDAEAGEVELGFRASGLDGRMARVVSAGA